MTPANAPLGVFDSGIGGLSILLEIRRRLPSVDIVYFADQAHVPYGPRPLDEIRRFSEAITRFLLAHGAGAIVVACNTASAAALSHLRMTFPEVPFVGMEPAVKPAAETSRTGVVGVLATPATFQGALFASVVERFAREVRLINQTVPGLVERIEAGDLDGPETRRLLVQALAPIQAAGADTVVLACTHYPFVIPLLEEILGPQVRVIDPAPAIARQVERVLEEPGPVSDDRLGTLSLLTSGDPEALQASARRLSALEGIAAAARWSGGRLTLPPA